MKNGRRSLEPTRARAVSWLDVGLAVSVGALVQVHTAIAPPGRTDVDLLGYALLVIGPLALIGRSRAPTTVLLVTTFTMFWYQILGYPGVVAGLPVLVAIYTSVRSGHRVIVWLVTGLALTKGAAATIMMSTPDEPVREVLESRLLLAGWLIAAGVIGEVARKQHAYLHEVKQRAAEAEQSREEAALRRASEERLRIARELHDSLTHMISVIKVQAGVAVHLARKRGEQVPEALEAIQDASTDAVRELRSTLEVLRADDGVPGRDSGAPPRSIANCLDQLPDLAARAKLSGVPTKVTVTGDERALPADADRAAYRIVQEALTNVTRHAGPGATASIHLIYAPDALTVQVDDDGTASADAPPVAGVGLRGMYERVSDLRGTLIARPRPEGGFRIRAELPLPDGSNGPGRAEVAVAASTNGAGHRATSGANGAPWVPATEQS